MICLVVQVGGAEKFPQALGLESLDPFLGVSMQRPCLTTTEKDGHEKRPAQLELVCEADSIASTDPV